MHKVLKDVLDSPILGFNTLIHKIHGHLETQIRTVRESMESDRIKIPNKLNDVMEGLHHLFAPLIHQVSHVCFELLLAMYYDIANENYNEICDDHWWRDCFGIPCIHRMVAAIVDDTPIQLHEIHIFWRQLHWEGCTDTCSSTNNTVPISVPDIVWRSMVEKYSRGELSRDQICRITSCYEDCQVPSQTEIIEPSVGKEKGRPKGTTKYSRRDKTHLEHKLAMFEKGKDKHREEDDFTTPPPKPKTRRSVSLFSSREEDDFTTPPPMPKPRRSVSIPSANREEDDFTTPPSIPKPTTKGSTTKGE